MTIKDAEKIREGLQLTVYEFSMRLGYSPTAYYYAKRHGRMSRWMAREIQLRYGRTLTQR